MKYPNCLLVIAAFLYNLETQFINAKLENVQELKLKENKTVDVVNELVFKANFKDVESISASEKITIDSRILYSETKRNVDHAQVNVAVFYNEYSESWVLINHTVTTLCVGKSASLIIVVQNPNPRSTVKINISIYPKDISLSVDGEAASQDVSISAPLTYIVDPTSSLEFKEGNRFVLTVDDETPEVVGEDTLCMIVAVYDGQCPLKDRTENIFTAKIWTTALEKATITIDTKKLKFFESFYVTILVTNRNSRCHRTPGKINEESMGSDTNHIFQLGKARLFLQHDETIEPLYNFSASDYFLTKRVRTRITTAKPDTSYILPIFVQMLWMLFFIAIALIVMLVRRFGGEEDIKTFDGDEKEQVEMRDMSGQPLQAMTGDQASEQELKIISGNAIKEEGTSAKDVEGNVDSIYEDCPDYDVVDGFIDDLVSQVQCVMATPDTLRYDKRSKQKKERIRNGLCRFREHPTLADMTKIVDKNVWFRRNRSRVYFYIVPLLSLYYFVPAIQFAFLAKQNEVSTGSQDLCYHNFRCSKPFYIFSDFNHVVSNLSYAVFGLAFMGLVWIKEKKLPSHCFDYNVKTGILQQLSIFYAMGFSLMAQGFFSVCYHVCPTNLSLQFDTTMMYILCTLCFVKIYQFRHPDATANAYSIFMYLGALVLLEALTLYSSSWWIFS